MVFVCYGNICRSPFAAAVFERELNGTAAGRRPTVASAGFHARTGRSPPPEALSVAREFGVDLDSHRSCFLGGSSAFDGEDPVSEESTYFAMDQAQRRRLLRRGIPRPQILLLGDLDPQAIDRRKIVDPYGKPQTAFKRVYARIDRCVREAAALMTAGPTAPTG